MIIIDLLFKICFAPLSKYDEKGKLAAAFWLAPPLSFLVMGLINIVLYFLKPIVSISLTPIMTGILGGLICIGLIFIFDRIYIRDKRPIGNAFHPLSGLLILPMIFGALVLYVMSMKYAP